MNQFASEIDKFDDIWLFVEDKLHTSVPAYFKNVLKVCGYNNGITIASIEEDDLVYIEGEVRNGNVAKYFVGSEEKNMLEGCTKNKDNFEFVRGHKTFLMFIVNFLKMYSVNNGWNRFTSESTKSHVKSKRKARSRIAEVPNKKMRFSVFESVLENTNVPICDNLSVERSNFLTKAITSLINHSPEMYIKACVRDVEMKLTKLSNDLVTMEIDKTYNDTLIEKVDRYIGSIVCPFCSKRIPVAHSSTQLSSGLPGKPWWNTSNFYSHLKIYHTHPDVKVEVEDKNEEFGKNMEKQTSIIDSFDGMLRNFINSAERNADRRKPGYRHDIITKMFAGFIKMVAGLLAYETLHANFPLSLPSVSIVNRFITDYGPQIIEGEMRIDELLHRLKSRNLPLRISLSEDATRITAKISYDPKTNQLIGFALPLDTNGMPIISSFPARNVREIQSHYTNTSNYISSTAYVQMAQPTELDSSPFCFMMYSTDNKFTALNIYRRWQFQASKLKERGVTINNISSDGDSRPLMAMKVLSCIGQSDRSYLDCEWFSCGGYTETTCTQDYVHVVTKARNRVLKCSRVFPIGNKIISCSHLKYLIDNVSKDKHLLTNSDIEPKDRQNFLSAEKVCSENTMKCLLDYVPGSEGTVVYLKCMRSVLDAFQRTEITSEERIYLIWYACFFCRAWRSWLLNSDKSKMTSRNRPKSYYNLKENFMSSNCYTCIELNAHALVKQVLIEDTFSDDSTCDESVVENLSSNERSKFFFSALFDSQVCESIFRQIRSFSSTFCTVVNFTMLDIMNRIRKIQLQNEIINNSNGKIKFPRFEKKAANISTSISEGKQQFNGLNRKTIISQIEKARNAVIDDLDHLEIDTSKLNFHCQIQPAYEKDMTGIDCDLECDYLSDSDDELRSEHSSEHENEHPEDDFFNNDDDENDKIWDDINFLSGITGELMLKNYDLKVQEQFDEDTANLEDDIVLDEKSPFVVVVDNTGKSKAVRKSAVCYVLSKDKHKLSSDRLQRVQEKEYALNNSRNNSLKSVPNADNFVVNPEISIGEWCIFPNCDDIEDEYHPVLLGLVLGFTYLIGNTFKEREFSKPFASVQSNSIKGVGVLCDFYSFNEVGVLKTVYGDKHTFIKVDSYIGTIKPPIIVNKSLTISPNLVVEINKIDL